MLKIFMKSLAAQKMLHVGTTLNIFINGKSTDQFKNIWKFLFSYKLGKIFHATVLSVANKYSCPTTQN